MARSADQAEMEKGDRCWTVRVQALECTERSVTVDPVGGATIQALALMDDDEGFAQHFGKGSDTQVRIEAVRARELVHPSDGPVEWIERSAMWKNTDTAWASVRESETLPLLGEAGHARNGPIGMRLGKARRIEMEIGINASADTAFREVARMARAEASSSPKTRWASAIPWDEPERYIAWIEVAGVRCQAPEGARLRELYVVRVVRLVEEWIDVVVEGVREPGSDRLEDAIGFADEDGSWHDRGSAAEYVASIRAVRSTGTETERDVPSQMRMLARL